MSIQSGKEFVKEYQQNYTTFNQIVTALLANPTFFDKEDLSSNEEVVQRIDYILAISSTIAEKMCKYFESDYYLYRDLEKEETEGDC